MIRFVLFFFLFGLLSISTANAESPEQNETETLQKREVMISVLQHVKQQQLSRQRILGTTAIVGGGISMGYGQYLQANPTPCKANLFEGVTLCIIENTLADTFNQTLIVGGATSMIGGALMLPDWWNKDYDRYITYLEEDGSIDKIEVYLEVKAKRARFRRLTTSAYLFSCGTAMLFIGEELGMGPAMALYAVSGFNLAFPSPAEKGLDNYNNQLQNPAVYSSQHSHFSVSRPTITIGQDGTTHLLLSGSF
jgi:hypothetical protein